jgi:hypothetical protein
MNEKTGRRQTRFLFFFIPPPSALIPFFLTLIPLNVRFKSGIFVWSCREMARHMPRAVRA